jgi:hypothetical protein
VLLSGGTLQLSGAGGSLSGFSGFTLNGVGATPVVTGGTLQLTDGNSHEAVSAFAPTIVSNAKGFTASFLYTPTYANSYPMADGFTFTIQNDPRGASALGGAGGGLGYGVGDGGTAIANSAAIQLNLYDSTIGFGTNGTVSDNQDATNGGTVDIYPDGFDQLQYTLSYNGVTKVLSETIDDVSQASYGDPNTTATFTYPLDLNSVLGGIQAYVGFTGGSGDNTAIQQISNFTFSNGGISGPSSISNPISTLAGTKSVLNATVVPGANVATIGTLTLASNSTLTVTSTDNGTGAILTLVTPGLTIAGSTGHWTGLLDLTTTSLDVQNGNLATITNQVKQGYANGTWQGSGGITSSTAAADPSHLTALGVIVNTDANGNQLYGSGGTLGLFDGASPGPNDVLVKFTYYGDTDLSGTVDGSDYSRIDNAYLTDKTTPGALTGWFNGDFNYDGVIDGSDYTLIDNAFNQQGVSLAAQVASQTALVGTSAVPEPATLGLLALGGAGMLGRRRRNR